PLHTATLGWSSAVPAHAQATSAPREAGAPVGASSSATLGAPHRSAAANSTRTAPPAGSAGVEVQAQEAVVTHEANGAIGARRFEPSGALGIDCSASGAVPRTVCP